MAALANSSVNKSKNVPQVTIIFFSFLSFLNRVISNYIAWTVVRNLIDALPKRYGSAYTKFLSDVFKTDLQGKPKWIKCIEVTTDVFPLPTASLFAAHALPKDRVNEVKKFT